MNTHLKIAAILCAFIALPHNAIAYDDYKAQFTQEQFLENDDKGFSYHFIGDAEEEGALKLFVMDTASEHALIDPSADTLSKITPAAGIQLHFEF